MLGAMAFHCVDLLVDHAFDRVSQFEPAFGREEQGCGGSGQGASEEQKDEVTSVLHNRIVILDCSYAHLKSKFEATDMGLGKKF